MTEKVVQEMEDALTCEMVFGVSVKVDLLEEGVKSVSSVNSQLTPNL